jgi:hypothetical protein
MGAAILNLRIRPDYTGLAISSGEKEVARAPPQVINFMTVRGESSAVYGLSLRIG